MPTEDDMTVTTTDAAHLLRRAGFGVTPTALAEITKLANREAAILKVTDVSKAPAPSLPITNARQADEGAAFVKLNTWWLDRMRTTPTPIVEKLVLFWHDHFVSSAVKLADMGLLAQQQRTIRAYATGDFHALAQAVAIDPAMQLYLDNWLNIASAPQENFGRELMELFTLGTGQYTQDDVVSMTKAWTGHGTNPLSGNRTYQFKKTYHVSTPSTLFGKTQVWDGPQALTEILKGVKAEASSKFIAAKLFSYFAYPVKANDPVVAPIAAAFRSANLDILALVRAIFRSDAFWSPQARNALVRSPIEWLVSAMQVTGITAAQGVTTAWLDRCGQCPFLHADVNGWPKQEAWLSSAVQWSKESWAAGIRAGLFSKRFLSTVGNLTAAKAVDAACEKLGIVDVSPSTRAALEALHAQSKAGGYSNTTGVNMTMALLLSPEFQVV